MLSSNIFSKIYKILFVTHYSGYVKEIYTRYIVPWIIARHGVQLGKNITFAGYPIISVIKDSILKIGNNVILCSKSEKTALGINHPVVLRTLQKGAVLEIGNGVKMSGASICAAKSIVIGENTYLGANVTIADTDFHSLNYMQRLSENDLCSAKHAAVEIEPNVFIGAGSYILKGVTIGECAVIGAGSVVVKNIPAFTIAAGNPAKVIREIPRH